MIIITLVLLFQGVLSQSITVTPNTTSIDILKGGNSTIEYKINPGLSNDWVVEMNFGDSFHDFFIHRSGQPYTPPEECLNCNVTFNNLTTTFTLNLYNVTNDNIGTYVFKLKNIKNVFIYRMDVHVRDKPVLLTSDVSGLEFSNLKLNCSINTEWFEKIRWVTSNNSTIKQCNRSTSHDSQTCLAVLYNVTKASQGVYTCNAENPTYYSISKSVKLDILYGPDKSTLHLNKKAIFHYSYITVKEGDILNISCIADCNPNCNYTWNTNKSTGSFLTVTANRKTAGFTCTAENQYGKNNSSVRVNVLYSSGITNIMTLNGKTTTNETDNISVHCFAVGNPIPSIIWLKNGEAIKKNNIDHFVMNYNILKSEESRSGNLVIKVSGCNATGNYSCISYNGIGNDSKTLSIFVNCKPTILRPKENLKNQIGTDTVFEVWYEAYPVPKFKWTFLAENGIEDEDVTSSFLVVNVVDETYRFRSLLLLNRTYTRRTGHYRIDIWNFLGHASSQIYIQDSKAVHVNVYKVLLLTILCIVFPIYIVIECTIRIKKRRNATGNRAEEIWSDQSDADSRNVYANRVREIELAASRPYEDLSINAEISAYDDVGERRELTNTQDLAREDSNKQGSAYSSVSERDIDGDGYLNMKEHRIPVFCIRQDPNEQDLTESSVSGGDKDADGYLIMKGQNIPDNCKRSNNESTKSMKSIENKKNQGDDGYIQMEAPSPRTNKEKASDEIGNIAGFRQ